MENASKALIIAGAILLAILLISLGIMIYSQAQDTVSNSGMSDAEKTAFNSRLSKYAGKQKGSVVRSMVNEVIAMNSDPNNSDKQVTINGAAPTGTETVDTSKQYTVTITTSTTTGLITNVAYN